MQSPSSTSPVGRSGLTVPSGRGRTVPSTASTYSLRTSTVPVDHALDDAGVVAQVDEGQVLAVLAPPGHPAADGHLGARRRRAGATRTGGCASTVASAGRGTVTGGPFGNGTRSRDRGHSRGTAGGSPTDRLPDRLDHLRPAARCVWSPAPRRGRRDTVPAAISSGPTMRATRAPDRSAALIWDFMERPSKARSARSPARRSSAVRSRAASPPACRPRRRRGGRAPTANTPSASQASSTRSMPMPNPMPGVGGPPSISTRPS